MSASSTGSEFSRSSPSGLPAWWAGQPVSRRSSAHSGVLPSHHTCRRVRLKTLAGKAAQLSLVPLRKLLSPSNLRKGRKGVSITVNLFPSPPSPLSILDRLTPPGSRD